MFTRRLFVVVLVGILLGLPRVAAGEETRERWYVLELSGSRAGWMRSTPATATDMEPNR